MPSTLLFLGESGEYELVFTLNKEKELEFIQEAEKQNMKFLKIGFVTGNYEKTLFEDERTYDLSKIKISARDFKDKKEYIGTLLEYLKN